MHIFFPYFPFYFSILATAPEAFFCWVDSDYDSKMFGCALYIQFLLP